MCLYVKNRSCLQTAKNEIVVYKVLKIDNCGEIISPYRNFHYESLDLYSLVHPLEKIRSRIIDNNYLVKYGYHSFATIRDAKHDQLDWHFQLQTNQFKIFKCIIPQGSKYYVGKFQGRKSYCSNQIIIVEELK